MNQRPLTKPCLSETLPPSSTATLEVRPFHFQAIAVGFFVSVCFLTMKQLRLDNFIRKKPVSLTHSSGESRTRCQLGSGEDPMADAIISGNVDERVKSPFRPEAEWGEGQASFFCSNSLSRTNSGFLGEHQSLPRAVSTVI